MKRRKAVPFYLDRICSICSNSESSESLPGCIIEIREPVPLLILQGVVAMEASIEKKLNPKSLLVASVTFVVVSLLYVQVIIAYLDGVTRDAESRTFNSSVQNFVSGKSTTLSGYDSASGP